MNAPHWIDRHFTSPEERAAKIKAEAEAARRDSRGRVLRLVFLMIPILLASVAILGAGAAAALNYYGVVDLAAFAPQLPRKAPAVITPALSANLEQADQPLPPDLFKMVMAPAQTSQPAESPSVEPEPAQPIGQPVNGASSDRMRKAVAMLASDLAQTDAGIASVRAALYIRPWASQGGRPAPWTDAEHLIELEAYWNRSRLNAVQAWDYNRAHDAWIANVRNDQRRLAELTAKRASIADRLAKANQ